MKTVVSVRKLKVNYPIALGTKRTKSLFTSSDTLPITVIIDREGNIPEVIEGILFSDEFDQKVRPLLSDEWLGGARRVVEAPTQ